MEELLRLPHLGALQVPHLGRQPLDARWRSRPASQKNAAWRSRGITWVETGSAARPSFAATYSSTRGSTWAKVPTAPRDGAGGDFRPRRDQPRAVAGEFGVMAGELQAEAGRLGMDAVAAADGQRVLVLEGAGPSARPAPRRDRRAADPSPGSAARRGRCPARRSWSCPDARSGCPGRRPRPAR